MRNHQQGWLAPFVGPRCRIHRQDAATSAVPRGTLHLAPCSSCWGKLQEELLWENQLLPPPALLLFPPELCCPVPAAGSSQLSVGILQAPGMGGQAGARRSWQCSRYWRPRLCSGPAPAASPPPPDPSKMQPVPPALSRLLLGLMGGSAGDTPNARTSVRLAVLGALLCSESWQDFSSPGRIPPLLPGRREKWDGVGLICRGATR